MSPAGSLRREGVVLLDQRLEPPLLERLRERFLELLAEHAGQQPTNRGPARYQIYLPWEPPFDDPGLWARPEVLEVVQDLLGPDPALVYLASDTPLPGSEYQKVHADTRQLFPEAPLAMPPYGLVLNVPLVDCTEENGSLEYWPGTHLFPPPVSPSVEAETLSGIPSCRANMPAGSLLLRDLRLWHRGTPNRSSSPRPHLAVVYVRGWYRFEQQPPAIPAAAWETLPEAHRALLRHARRID